MSFANIDVPSGIESFSYAALAAYEADNIGLHSKAFSKVLLMQEDHGLWNLSPCCTC